MPEFMQTSPDNPETRVIDPKPEFVDFRELKRLFGIPRSTAYELLNEGEIRSVSLRRRGKAKGRRLIDCDSVRAFLTRNVHTLVKTNGGCPEKPKMQNPAWKRYGA